MLNKAIIAAVLALGLAAPAALAGPTGKYTVKGAFKMVSAQRSSSTSYRGTLTVSLRSASFRFILFRGNDTITGSVLFPRPVSAARFRQSLTGTLRARDVTGTATVTLTKAAGGHYTLRLTSGATAVSGQEKGAKYTLTGTGSK